VGENMGIVFLQPNSRLKAKYGGERACMPVKK